MKPIRVLWRSRHGPQEKHKELLKELFPDREIDITLGNKWIFDAEEVFEEFEEGGYDDLYVGAPLAILKILAKLVEEKNKNLEEGEKKMLPPLTSHNKKCSPEDADFQDGHAFWKIVELQRVHNVIIDSRKATPVETTQ